MDLRWNASQCFEAAIVIQVDVSVQQVLVAWFKPASEVKRTIESEYAYAVKIWYDPKNGCEVTYVRLRIAILPFTTSRVCCSKSHPISHLKASEKCRWHHTTGLVDA